MLYTSPIVLPIGTEPSDAEDEVLWPVRCFHLGPKAVIAARESELSITICGRGVKTTVEGKASLRGAEGKVSLQNILLKFWRRFSLLSCWEKLYSKSNTSVGSV